MCEMTESKPGVVKKCHVSPVEMEATKSDSYQTVLSRAVKKCKLSRPTGTIASLFKLNGCRILDEAFVVKNESKEWTLGNYMSVMKKSASNIKLGVAYISVPIFSDSGEESPMDSVSPTTVSSFEVLL